MDEAEWAEDNEAWLTDLSWQDKPLRQHWPKLAGDLRGLRFVPAYFGGRGESARIVVRTCTCNVRAAFC